MGQDPDTTRADETIGFIVIEAGQGSINGVEFEALLGADLVRGIDDGPPCAYTFSSAFSGTPTIAVTTQGAMDGSHGSHSMTYRSTPSSATQRPMVVDEDQIADAERFHTTEQLGYAVFATPMSFP